MKVAAVSRVIGVLRVRLLASSCSFLLVGGSPGHGDLSWHQVLALALQVAVEPVFWSTGELLAVIVQGMCRSPKKLKCEFRTHHSDLGPGWGNKAVQSQWYDST